MKLLYFCGRAVACLLFAFSATLSAQQLLTLADVQPTMQQIFDQHVDQKEITPKAIKSAFRVYIDKFDPDRIYLLASEVKPYLELSDQAVAQIIQAYKQNRFTAFEELNRTIQSAIQRSRLLRQEIEKNPGDLFSVPAQPRKPEDPDLKKPFAQNPNELRQRISSYLVQFINAEKRQFGQSVVLANQAQTLEIFEKSLRQRENGYLYLDEHGQPLPKSEQDNLFVLHLLKALASSLDAHTTFYDESEASDLKTRLEKEFQGVGIVFKQSIGGAVVVNDLSDGGPAAKSGMVKIGDSVLEVDNKKVAGMSIDKVMSLIRSSEGKWLLLTLKRKGDGQIVKVKLQKQEITLPGERAEVSFKTIDGGIIGLITLNSFYQNASGVTSENDIRKALGQLNQKGNLRGLIVDMRQNSGGFLNQAVKVAGLFITNGVVVVSKYFNGEEHYYRDLDGKTFYEGPLVILTSRATASAAEVVAQALQDYGVAVIVGDETTYGKGTIQNQNVTTGGQGKSLFKVTVGKYYTVSGKTPQLEGVKADILVPGVFNFEHLGEQYLEFTVQNDSIPSEYSDDLGDVNPNLKAWYQRNYLPTLQAKTTRWQRMLPILKERSSERLSQNQDFQAFLKQARAGQGASFYRNAAKSTDFQLDEAANIVQDMIQLEKQERIKTIAEHGLSEEK